MSWAFEQQTTREPGARFLLVTLGNYANTAGASAFPSLETLVGDTGMNRRTIQKHLRNLEAIGLIAKDDPAIVAAHVKRADRRPVGYRLALNSQVIHRGGITPPRSEPTGRRGVPDGAALTTSRGGVAPPDPSSNHQRSEEGAQIARARIRERIGKTTRGLSAGSTR